MEQGSRTRLLTAAVLVVVFGAGVLMGLAADSNLSAESPDVLAYVETPDTTEAEAPPRRRAMYEEVAPNEEQLALIQSIMAEHRARTNAFDEEMQAESRAGFGVIVSETRNAIKAVLTPEQAAQYQVLLDAYDARRAEERAAKEAAEGKTGDGND